MIDFLSMSLVGVSNHSRVRVLWKHGLLRAFSVDGLVLELKTMKPTRLKGFLSRWQVDNDLGSLTMARRCITCGGPGWWKVLRVPSEELWRTAM
jgi:hypothetical protein